MAYVDLERSKALQKNRTAKRRTMTLVEKCELRNRWRGETCREAWPVSRFAWCNKCSEQKDRQIKVRRVKVAS